MDKRSWIDYFGVRWPDLNSNPQYLAAVIERSLITVLASVFKKDTGNWDLYAKSYPDIPVEQDVNGTYFATVPVRIIQLPGSQEGVLRITATEDQKTILFVSVPKDSWSTFNLLDVSKISTLVPFSLTNNRVEFANKPATTKVTMDVVRAFMDLGDNEEVAIPAGHELEFEQMVTQMITGTPPPNKSNV